MLLPDDWKAILRLAELGWKLLKNWALAKGRGIEEAAHDVAIHVAVACLADMADRVSDNAIYAIPEPDLRWYQFTLNEWLRSGDKQTAARVLARGVQLGKDAAKDIINKAEARAIDIKGIVLPDGGIRILRGLARARPDAITLLPSQGYGVMWLRDLKKRYKTRDAIYGYLIDKLIAEGVKTRAGAITSRPLPK